MKRKIALLLAICMLAALAGCRKTPGQETTPATEPTGENTEVLAPAPKQEPMVSVALPATSQTATAEDGTPLFTYTYQNISLIVPEPEIADKVILDFLNRIDQTTATAETVLTKAESAYTTSDGWTPYLFRIAYDPMRIDHGILSLFGTQTVYTGTPHPEHTAVSVTYDLVTGNVLPLNGAITADASAEQLCNLALEALEAIKTEKYLYEDFAATVKSRITGDLSGVYNWYFSQNGLCFYFAHYEIAPYASGIVTAEIPYDKLVGIIDDAYFPTEHATGSGSVVAKPFDSTDLDAFTQISEAIVKYGAQQLLLYTETSVYDVRLETGSIPFAGAEFLPEHTVFASHSLTPGDAIMVEADLADATQLLRLTYQSAGETVSVFIQQNSQDNTIQLTETI